MKNAFIFRLVRRKPHRELRGAALAVLTLFLVFPSLSQSAVNKNMTVRSTLNNRGPAQTGQRRVTRSLWGFTDGLGRNFVAISNLDHLKIWDISNPDAPVLAKSLPLTPGATDLRAVITMDTLLYMGNQTGRYQIANIADPYNADTVKSVAITGFNGDHTWQIFGNYSYLGMNGVGNRNLVILDMTDPLNPVKIQEVPIPTSGAGSLLDSHDSYVYGDSILYVAFLEGGWRAYRFVNKAAAPSPLTNFITYGAPSVGGTTSHSMWSDKTNQILYTNDEVLRGRMRLWNVRDFTQVVQLPTTYNATPADSNSVSHNSFVRGDLLFVAMYVDGVRILDIEDPSYPVEVAGYDTSPAGNGIFSPSTYVDGAYDVYAGWPGDSIVVAAERDTLSAPGHYVLSFNPNLRAGRIAGGITDASNGIPLPDAIVRLLDVDKSDTTDGSGNYIVRTIDGLRQMEISHWGFRTDTVSVTAFLNDTVTFNHALTPLSAGQLLGRVTSPSGNPIPGVIVGLQRDQYFSDVTDLNGEFSLNVPADSLLYVKAVKWGNGARSDTVRLSTGQTDTLDFQLGRGYIDDFEYDLGWSFSDPSDNGTTGFWERVRPKGQTGPTGAVTQPDSDVVGIVSDLNKVAQGTKALITGQGFVAANYTDHDVDGGRVTVISPVFDATPFFDPLLSFYRWIASTAGDSIVSEISSDGGATWPVALERFRFNGPAWTQRLFLLESVPGLTLTATMRVRVRLVDHSVASSAEGGIDNFAVTDRLRAGDVDNNAGLDAADVVGHLNYTFLGELQAVPANAMDYDGDCQATASDVIILLNAVFLSQPILFGCLP